jgi:hypothetical protein
MTTPAQRTKNGDSDWDKIFILSVTERLEKNHKAYFPPEGFTSDIYQSHFWLLVEKYAKDKSPTIMADLHALRDGKTFSPDDELFLRIVPSSPTKQAYTIYVMDFDGSETKLVDIITTKGVIEFARTKNERLVPIMKAIEAEFEDFYSGEILERKKRDRATNTKSKRAAKRRRHDEAEEVNENEDDDDDDDEEEEEEDDFDNCQVVNNDIEVNGDGQM